MWCPHVPLWMSSRSYLPFSIGMCHCFIMMCTFLYNSSPIRTKDLAHQWTLCASISSQGSEPLDKKFRYGVLQSPVELSGGVPTLYDSDRLMGRRADALELHALPSGFIVTDGWFKEVGNEDPWWTVIHPDAIFARASTALLSHRGTWFSLRPSNLSSSHCTSR